MYMNVPYALGIIIAVNKKQAATIQTPPHADGSKIILLPKPKHAES